MSDTNVVKTPDGMNYAVESDAQKLAFAAGFCAALRCYGIWKSGTQTIGCLETPVRDVIKKFKQDNAISVD